MSCSPNSLLLAENTGLVQSGSLPTEACPHLGCRWKSLWKSGGRATGNRFRNPWDAKRSVGRDYCKESIFNGLCVAKAALGLGDSRISRPLKAPRICTEVQQTCSVRVTRIGSCAYSYHSRVARATGLDSVFESAPLTHRESRTILNRTANEGNFGQLRRCPEKK